MLLGWGGGGMYCPLTTPPPPTPHALLPWKGVRDEACVVHACLQGLRYGKD